MMDLSMNFDMEECIVTAMLDQGNRIDTMEAIDRGHTISCRRFGNDYAGLRNNKKTVLHER